MKKISLVFILCLSILTIYAQETKTLTYFVTVTSPDGIPEANAKVVYENTADKSILKGVTDAEGKSKIDLIQGQTYTPKVYQYDTVFAMGAMQVPVGNYSGVEMKYLIKFTQVYTKIYELDIHFNTNKYDLGKEAVKELDALVNTLKTQKTQKIELAAHTDNVGSDVANMLLSQNRANSVRDYLIKNGIAADRLIAKGYGETKPKAPNDTDAGRAQNRRTEVRIISE